MIDLMISDDDVSSYLRRRNSIYRFNLRQIEKNRFPVKCHCAVCGGIFLCRNIEQYVRRQYYLGPDKSGNVRHVCWGCDLNSKVKISSGTLYHLINALPQAERDRQEIYPEDFRTALIPLPVTSNWGWRTLDEWHREGVSLCGMTAKAATGQDSLGLRDYSEGTRLLTKFGKYEFAYRQKAASSALYILATPEVAAFYLWLLGEPPSAETQQLLKRSGRLYKNSCYFRHWPSKEKRRPFDKAEALSWKKAQLWKAGQVSIKFDPADAAQLQKQDRAEMFRIGRSGGAVQHLEGPAKRHARLTGSQAAYNKQSASFWLVEPDRAGLVGLSTIMRLNRSLNIPQETIEARNAMLANLERDFARYDKTRVA